MTSVVYDSALLDEATGALDFDTHTFKAMLVSAAYVENPKTHTKRSDITNEVTGAGWAAGGVTVTVTVVLDAVNDVVDVNFAAINVSPVTLANVKKVIYYRSHGGAATLDELVMCADLPSALSPSNGNISIGQMKYRKTRGGGGAIINVPVNQSPGVTGTGVLGTVFATGAVGINRPPVWAPVGNFIAQSGVAQNFDVTSSVTDPDGDALIILLESGAGQLPAGWTYSSGLKRFQYDGTPGNTNSGVVMRLSADDGASVNNVTGLAATGRLGNASGSASPDAIVHPTGVAAGSAAGNSGSGTGRGWPNTITQLTPAEMAPGDSGAGVGSWYSPTLWTYETNPPGTYVGFGDGAGTCAKRWQQAGGDWKNAFGTLNDSTNSFASAIVATGTEAPVDFAATNLTNLVKDWVNGIKPNYGFFMKSRAGSSTVQWRSRFYNTPGGDSDLTLTHRPTLIVNTASVGDVLIACRRSAWLDPSSTLLGDQPRFQTTLNLGHGLLWFDLGAAGITNAADINSVTLRCWKFGLFSGSQTTDVHATWNPNDPGYVGAQQLGLAANYPLDVGLINDPDVLMVESFVDANFPDTRLIKGNTAAGGWSFVSAASDSNGYTKLPTGDNAIKGTINSGGLNLAFEFFWSPFRGVNHPKGTAFEEELFTRFYGMMGLDWNPTLLNIKWPGGYDMRHGDIGNIHAGLGMGRGNSSSFDDGITGGSMRDMHGLAATYDHPLANVLCTGNSDPYMPDQAGLSGPFMPHDIGYAGTHRRGQWFCYDTRIVMNSVSDPTAIPVVVQQIVRSGTTATITLSQPNARWTVPGAVRQASIGGVSSNTSLVDGGACRPYNYSGNITIIDSTHATFPIAATATGGVGFNIDPASVYTNSNTNSVTGGWQIWLVDSVGNFDGVKQTWANGYMCQNEVHLRMRHSKWNPDGVTPFCPESWFTLYYGGTGIPNFTGSCYFAKLVVARKYIGPMVLS